MSISLSRAIRSAAARKKKNLAAFRPDTHLSSAMFYRLLAGEEPKTVRTVLKLQAAGVRWSPPKLREFT